MTGLFCFWFARAYHCFGCQLVANCDWLKAIPRARAYARDASIAHFFIASCNSENLIFIFAHARVRDACILAIVRMSGFVWSRWRCGNLGAIQQAALF